MTITGTENTDDIKLEIARRIYTAVVLNSSSLKVKDVVKVHEIEHFVNVLKKRTHWNGIKPFLQHYPCFFLITDENNFLVIKPIVTVEFCRDFDGKKGCGKPYCAKLHVCRHFVKGKCTFGPRCKKPHHFENQSTREVLKKHFLDDLSNEQAREFLCRNVQHLLEPDTLSTELPKSLEICKYYNVATGCTRDFCPYIHVCRFFAEEGNCKFGSQCIRKHDINNVHSRILLHRYHMDHLSDPQVITYLKIKGESRDQQPAQNGAPNQNIKNETQATNCLSSSLNLPSVFPNHFSLPSTTSNNFFNDMQGIISESENRKLSQSTVPLPTSSAPIVDEPVHARKLSLPNPPISRPGVLRPPVSLEEDSSLFHLNPSSMPHNLYIKPHQENRKFNETISRANSFTSKKSPEMNSVSNMYSQSNHYTAQHSSSLRISSSTSSPAVAHKTNTSSISHSLNSTKDIDSLHSKFLSYLNNKSKEHLYKEPRMNNNNLDLFTGLGLNNLSSPPPNDTNLLYNTHRNDKRFPTPSNILNQHHCIKSKSYENFQNDYVPERNHVTNGYISKPQPFYKPFSTSLQTDVHHNSISSRSNFFRTSSSDIISPTGSSSSVNAANGMTNGLTDHSSFFGSSDWTDNEKNFDDELNQICYRTRSLPNFNAPNLDKIIDKTRIMNLKNQLLNECHCQNNQICVFNLNGDCKLVNCQKLHTDDVFQWQISSFPEQALKSTSSTPLYINSYNNKNENQDPRQWVNIEKNENLKLELAFTSCDLEQTEIDFYGDTITIYFEDMIGVTTKNDIMNSTNQITSRSYDLSSWLLQPSDDTISRSGSQDNVIYNIRRISTKSAESTHFDTRFATQWLWYWQDSFGIWREYPRHKNDEIDSNICLSYDIEKKYIEGGNVFVYEEQQMVFDFKTMQQQTSSRKHKKIRRRSQFVSIEHRRAGENLATSNYVAIKTPYYWNAHISMNPYIYQLIDVDETSDIYNFVSKHFKQSVSTNRCEIVSLKSIQNIELWHMFIRFKSQCMDSNLKAEEKFVFKIISEKQLSGVCQQGFQICSCEDNTLHKSFSATSEDAMSALNYQGLGNGCKRSGLHYMFCVRMLLTAGEDESKDVGSVICKHANQVYPEFLIVFNNL